MRKLFSKISVRLLAFNTLLVFLPVTGILYLDVHENQMLRAQEQAMVQQGRLLAAALSEQGDSKKAEEILLRLRQRSSARLRVVDEKGWLLADSSLLGPRREPSDAAATPARSTRENWLYQFGAGAYRLLTPFFERSGSSEVPTVYYSAAKPLLGKEVRDALAGRYGAATRLIEDQRSVTLYSAIPIRNGGDVVGAVLVSQSTADIHTSLDEVRLGIFKVVLASVVVAVLLSLVVSQTIARPLRRLRGEAASLLDRRGRLKGRFAGSNRLDEIGDLARSLEELSSRLEDKIGFIESFAADVSHEFKNPLASIRNATELLAEVNDPKERRRFLDVAQSEIARLEKLLSTVKEITLIDARLAEEQVSPIGLKELLKGTVEGVKSRAGREIQFAFAFPDKDVVVQAVPERLVQVFENILENAVSFSPPGGTIDVRLQTDDGTAIVTIHDQGPGIPREHEHRIFSRFFTYRPDDGKSASPAKTKHVGLGLAIAKAIVEGYGGRISAEDDPGGGATFYVHLHSQPT